MPREKSDALFRLVKSMTKNEKRYFKLQFSKGASEESKFVKLFDCMCEQDEFNDDEILENNPEFVPSQLSNLKAELYNHLLSALRMFHDGKVIDIKIRQHLDYAQLLSDRCLYNQAVKQLNKAKKLAGNHENLELMLEAGRLEKEITGQVIDNNNQKRVNSIVAEVSHLTSRINRVNQLSNLESKLNSLYKKVGFIRDKRDHNAIHNYIQKNLPEYKEEELTDLEKIHHYNLFIGYYFFVHDFENAYLESKKFVSLFEENRSLVKSKTSYYIQSLNKLSIAQSKLSFYDEFIATVAKIQAIPKMAGLLLSRDLKTRIFKYYYMHELNRFMLLGDFEGGVLFIENEIGTFPNELDQHSMIIFYYKIASVYFGASDYNQSIQWLNRIISLQQVDIRRDIHCFARILNLVAHYELGNMDVIDYYIRSTYRFLAKKYDLRLYQQYILSFLKNLGQRRDRKELNEAFLNLKDQLNTLKNKPYERRAFIYFDIISWLESKVANKDIGIVIKEKALERIKTKTPVDFKKFAAQRLFH